MNEENPKRGHDANSDAGAADVGVHDADVRLAAAEADGADVGVHDADVRLAAAEADGAGAARNEAPGADAGTAAARNETSGAGSASRQVPVLVVSMSGGERLEQRVTADLYVKGRHYYLRYREPDPGMGRTMTTVRIAADGIRIVRQGDVRSEQTFEPNRTTGGYYETAQGKLPLVIATRSLSVHAAEDAGTAEWSYDLTVAGDPAGTYRLQVVYGNPEQR